MNYCIFLAIIVYSCLLETGTSSLSLDQNVCQHDFDCRIIDLKSICNNTSKKCECKPLFRLEENKCQVKDEVKITNQKCNNTKECVVKNLVSYCNTTSGFCYCPNGYLNSELFCKHESVIQITSRSCKSDENCVTFDKNSLCDTNTNKCICKKSYTDERSISCEKIKVKCIYHNQCNESNNEKCLFRHCNCKIGFKRKNDGLCVRKDYCIRQFDCDLKNNFRCNIFSGKCICMRGFTITGDKCKIIKRPCSENSQCDIVSETCNTSNRTCKCREIYDRSLSGACKLKPGYCNNETDCDNTDVTCDDNNRCRCISNKDFEIGKSCAEEDSFIIVNSAIVIILFMNIAIWIVLISNKRSKNCFKRTEETREAVDNIHSIDRR